MSPKKITTANGVITLHATFPVGLLKSEECTADVNGATESRRSPCQPRSTSKCVRAEKRDEASPRGPQPGAKQAWRSHTSLRRLQAKMEAENQQVEEIIQPIQDRENGFVKDMERFLSQCDVKDLRRRELLHKRWSERVWFPLQRRVEEHVSSCSPAEVKRRQSLYSHYLHHCNTRGFVFLETYDLREYNPFLLHIKKPHYFQVITASMMYRSVELSAADLKDPLYFQLHERLKEKRTARSCEAGCKYTRRQVENQPQSARRLCGSVTSQGDILLQASSNHPVTASRKTPAQDQTAETKSSRLDTIPYHIRATATPDGRCHQSGCSLSRRGSRQQTASLQQHQSLSLSK